ncbi:MAG: carbohydrate ABC transporter permease [bacterium]
MYLGKNARTEISHTMVHIVLILGSTVMLFPLFWMVTTSLKDLPQISTYPPQWIPNPVKWINYPIALTRLPFHLYFRNTMIIAGVVIVADLISCSLIAYGFARLEFPGRDFLFILLLSTLMLPYTVKLVPVYILFSKLRWINTFLPLTVPSLFGNPFFIFLIRQFFKTIPEDLADAARIDGCSEFGIWWKIMLPLSKPALAVVSIFAFQWAWNDFLGPLIYLNDEKLKTLALGLYAMRNLPYEEQYFHYLMAASTVMIVPIIIFFTIFQRTFIEGVTLTGLKG